MRSFGSLALQFAWFWSSLLWPYVRRNLFSKAVRFRRRELKKNRNIFTIVKHGNFSDSFSTRFQCQLLPSFRHFCFSPEFQAKVKLLALRMDNSNVGSSTPKAQTWFEFQDLFVCQLGLEFSWQLITHRSSYWAPKGADGKFHSSNLMRGSNHSPILA